MLFYTGYDFRLFFHTEKKKESSMSGGSGTCPVNGGSNVILFVLVFLALSGALGYSGGFLLEHGTVRLS